MVEMLGSALPSSATIHTSTSSATPTSPTRPSRLRGLSYLRSYTHNHLHSSSSRSDTPPLTRSTSTPAEPSPREPSAPRRRDTERDPSVQTSNIQSGENGWLPSVQGRSGLSRDSLNPTSSTESAHFETSNTATMVRNRTANGTPGPTPTPSSTTRSTARRTSHTEGMEQGEASSNAGTSSQKDPLPSIRFIPHHETRSSRPSLQFDTVERKLKQANNIIRVGRYSERDNAAPTDRQNVGPVGFKSKVVSRKHCEFWCTQGQWYVKDVKSSSGTFLNHVRLSAPGVESRPFPVNDGDVVQLGIDFKGGEEVIFRCVKIRIECNRGWQKSLNSFNTTAHKRLLKNAGVKSRTRDSDAASTNSSECSICLNPIAPCQALFVAPCSHVWHYKCVHTFIHEANYPNFLCPNCRAVADLEADVEQPEDLYEESIPEGFLDDEHDLSEGVKLGDDSAGHSSDNRDDLHHSENQSPSRNGNTSDDEDMSRLLEATSLHLPNGSTDETLHSHPTASRPMPIQTRRSQDRATPSEILTARSATPTTNAQFALAAGMMSMSEAMPMTPRNDAGPFVFDGAGGRGLAGQAVAEVDEPSSSPEGR